MVLKTSLIVIKRIKKRRQRKMKRRKKGRMNMKQVIKIRRILNENYFN
jgi:hypothetical protein